MLVALISDVHANRCALETVQEDARERGAERFWCIGDMVGYGPQPVEALRFLRDEVGPRSWVAGNHEAALVGRLDAEETGFAPDAVESLKLNREKLRDEGWWEWACNHFLPSDADRRAIRGGPGGRDRYILLHGSPVAPLTDYLRPWEEWKFEMEFKRLGAQHGNPSDGDALVCLIYGQVHIPCLYQAHPVTGKPNRRPLSDRYGEEIPLEPGLAILNPGSVGFPRDGDPRPAYALLDTQRRAVVFQRVEGEYDPRKTARDMRRGGYPGDVCEKLVRATRHPEWPDGWRV